MTKDHVYLYVGSLFAFIALVCANNIYFVPFPQVYPWLVVVMGVIAALGAGAGFAAYMEGGNSDDDQETIVEEGDSKR